MKVLFLLNIGFDTQGPSIHLLKEVMVKCVERGTKVVAIFRRTTNNNISLPNSLKESEMFEYEEVITEKIEKTNFIKRYLDEVRYAKKSYRQYKKFSGIDAVFIQSNNVLSYHTRYVKKAFDCPIMLNIQDIFPDNLAEVGNIKKGGLLYRYFLGKQIDGYKRAASIITISPDMKKTMENMIKDKTIDYVYNWSYGDSLINIKKEDNKFIIKYNIDQSKFNVVYAGNIGRLQNVDIIIQAAIHLQHNSNIYFHIVGDGVYKNRLMELTKSLKNISFYPMQPSSMAEDVYCSGNVNIIPLANGVIKTALPSKTATCLRINTPIIFCIDKESEFSKVISDNDMIHVVDSSDSKKLAKEIELLSEKRGNNYLSSPFELFEKMFTTNNAEIYVQKLEKICTESEWS